MAISMICKTSTLIACCATLALHAAPLMTQPVRYVVAVHSDDARVSGWRKVADALKRKHHADVLPCTFDDDGMVRLLPELQKRKPRYVCFVARPEHVGKDFIARASRLMRKINPDPYCDAVWGIVTGYNSKDALKLVSTQPGKIRSAATSMGSPKSLDAFSAGIASDERSADHIWVKRPGSATKEIATKGNPAKVLALAFNSIPVDYFVTSGHASERDWQIVFNQDKGKLVHTPEAGLQFVEPGGQARHDVKAASVRVYIGAGNCLIGHVDSRACMATAWMHAAGVEQFAGYTVPSWYGFMGWGVKDLFEQGLYSLPEARYLEDARLVWAQSRNPSGNDAKGLRYDCDAFALYGDPAQRILFPNDNTPYDVKVSGSKITVTFKRDCKFAPLNDIRGARPVLALLDSPPPGNTLFDSTGQAIPHAVVTERFIFIPLPGKHSAGETFVGVIR